MKIIVIVPFLLLWTMGTCQNQETTNTTSASKFSVTDVKKAIMTGLGKVTATVKLFMTALGAECIEPPNECPNVNITFWYYSGSNQETPIELSVSNLDSINITSENEHPWKIIIHGYTKSKNEIPNPQLRSAYFKKGQYNIISVDYEPLARDKCYISAVSNVPLIANCTAQMIDALMDKKWFTSDNLHVIGFSLGAQIAGLIHSYMKHPKPSRVTGLDPASPLFDGFDNFNINTTSGEFVDVIHTNALLKGTLTKAGHIDFYVNGGFHQKGCIIHPNKSVSTCSHERGPLYYAESINSEVGFWGIPCGNLIKFFSGACNTNETSLVIMGEYVPREAKGSYFLQTANKPPYALGKVTSFSDHLISNQNMPTERRSADFSE